MEKYTFKDGKIIKESFSIAEDLANSIDWIKLTNNFELDRIKDIVDSFGKKEDKLVIIKAIYEAIWDSGNINEIPLSVDMWLRDTYKELDDNHRELSRSAYDKNTKTLYLNVSIRQGLVEYFENHKEDIVNQRDNEKQLLQQIAELRAEVNKLTQEKAILEKTNLELQEKVNFSVSNIVIAEDRKIDVIKILHAMCKIDLFKMKDGSKFAIKEVMEFSGRMLNNNFTEYNSNLSTSKATTKETTYLKVFEDLRIAAYKFLKKS